MFGVNLFKRPPLFTLSWGRGRFGVPAETGEGSSGQPTPGYAKVSLGESVGVRGLRHPKVQSNPLPAHLGVSTRAAPPRRMYA